MSPSGSGQEIGKVINVQGNAWAEGPEGTRVLEKGDTVYEGESIITESGSNVEVKFLDDTLLSQGPDSVLRLDEYVFDLDNMDDSGLSFNLMQGTFRHVSGRIAEQNPERVSLESPLSLIGIRGTVTVHVVGPDSESHGVEDMSAGFQVIITDSFGEVRVITLPMTMLDVFADQPMGLSRPMTPQELQFFREIAPGALEGLVFDEDDIPDDEDIADDPEADPDDEDLSGEEDEDDGEDDPDGEDEPLPQVEVDEGGDDQGQQDDAPQARLYTPPPASPVSPAPPPFGPPDDDDDDDITAGQDSDDDDDDPADNGPPNDDPANWETLAHAESLGGGSPEYSWFMDRGFTIFDGNDGVNTLYTGHVAERKYAIFGFDDNDSIEINSSNYFDNIVYGGAGDDEIIIYGEGNNTVYGGSGNDNIKPWFAEGHFDGGAGKNTIDYSNIAVSPVTLNIDLLNNSAVLADDSPSYAHQEVFNIQNVVGTDGNDTIIGNSQDNMLSGGDGNDSIEAGSGNNQLIGGSGNDILVGGTGNDTMIGGDGDDEFRVTGGTGRINDLGKGNDELIVSSGGDVHAIVVDDWTPGTTTVNNGSASLQLQFPNGTAPNIVDLSNVGGTSGWEITGNDEGNNLTGSDNSDTITGGSGNDTINGGPGADTLTGGNGDDYFVFANFTDMDTITDFGTGNNLLYLDIASGTAATNGVGDLFLVDTGGDNTAAYNTTINMAGGLMGSNWLFTASNLTALQDAVAIMYSVAGAVTTTTLTLSAKDYFAVGYSAGGKLYVFDLTASSVMYTGAPNTISQTLQVRTFDGGNTRTFTIADAGAGADWQDIFLF